jgi:hypothetical protein
MRILARSRPSHIRATLVALLIVRLASVPLAAQQPPEFVPGSRVRVSVADGRRLTGRVEQATADTLVLLPEGQAALSIPIADVNRVDISRGSQSRGQSAWRYAKWGAAIGAASGAISLGLQHDQVGDGSSVGSAVALGAWSGMLFGGLIGAAIGAGHSGERWERVR